MPGVTSASGSGSGNSLSFLSSVMRSTSHTNPGKIISKKLWRPRSKSQSRSMPQITSPWTPPADIKVSYDGSANLTLITVMYTQNQRRQATIVATCIEGA